MSIRQPAAEKLARKLLELRPPRLEPLSPKLVETIAKVIQVYVDMDETQQQREAFDERYNAAIENTSKEK